MRDSFVWLIISILVLAACGTAVSPPSEIVPTTEEAEDATRSPTVIVVKVSESSSTIGERGAVIIEESATGEPSGLQLVALANLNLRSGPGTGYDIVGRLTADQAITIIGRSADSDWLLVESGTERAWLINDPGLIKIEGGTVSALAVVNMPSSGNQVVESSPSSERKVETSPSGSKKSLASAYDTSDPAIDLLLNQVPLVIYDEGRFFCASHAGIDHVDYDQIEEGDVIGPHAGDFVYEGNNVLFEYSQGTFEMVREARGLDFEDGRSAIPLDEAIRLFQSGELAWNGALGQWPGRGVTGCDPAASEAE